MKTFFLPVVGVLVLASGCGNLQSEKTSVNYQRPTDLAAGASLSQSDFVADCRGRGGRLESGESVCIAVAEVKSLANGGEARSDTFYDLEMFSVEPGNAVYAVGTSSGNLDLSLNGSRISAVPSANGRPKTVSVGGMITLNLQPGTFKGVHIYRYRCTNSSGLVPCPY